MSTETGTWVHAAGDIDGECANCHAQNIYSGDADPCCSDSVLDEHRPAGDEDTCANCGCGIERA
jgi:hypothetical protein